jgi:dTDP-4-amino-4,6-dideoxygalactose transaminase
MILMNDFAAEPAEIRDAMLDAAKRVLDSGWYVLGKEVQHLEREWAQMCGVPHAVGVGNGMDAIEIALRACDIGPGDEVITTSMTAFATVLAIVRAGAVPVLADIDANSGLLSVISVRRCITKRTRAIMVVHLYGQVRNMAAWEEICAEHDLILIEDAAQAHMAMSQGRSVGSFGLVSAFSFYPTKNLGAAGDAGMLVTRDESIARRASSLRNYGQSDRYVHVELGLNSRLDEIHAAMLIQRLKWLPQFTSRRQQIAKQYLAGIDNPLVRPLDPPDDNHEHVYHLFVVTCSRRDELHIYLSERGIRSLIHYPVPVHNQPPTSQLRRDPAGLVNCELHAQTCLSLPCHPQMNDHDAHRVIDALNAFGR